MIYGNIYASMFPPDPPIISRNTVKSFFETCLKNEITLIENKVISFKTADVKNRKIISVELLKKRHYLLEAAKSSNLEYDKELLIDLTVPRWFIKQAFPGSDTYLEKQHTKRDPKTNEQIARYLGCYYTGKPDEAMRGFAELKNGNPKDFQILLNAAILAITAGDINQAVLNLKHAAAVCRDADAVTRARPFWLLSRLYYSLENFPLALEYAELSLKINSSQRHLYRKMVYLFFNGFTDKAMGELKELMEANPEFRITALIDPDLSALTPFINPLVDEILTYEENSLVRLRERITARLNDPENAPGNDDKVILEKIIVTEKNANPEISFREIKERLERLYAGEKICSLIYDIQLLEKEKLEIESKLPELKAWAEKEEADRSFIYRYLPIKQIKYFIGNWFYTIFYSYILIVIFGSNLSMIFKRISAGKQLVSPGEMMTILYAGAGLALIFPLIRWIKNRFLSVEDTPDIDTPSLKRYKSQCEDLDICIRRMNDMRSQLESFRRQIAG